MSEVRSWRCSPHHLRTAKYWSLSSKKPHRPLSRLSNTSNWPHEHIAPYRAKTSLKNIGKRKKKVRGANVISWIGLHHDACYDTFRFYNWWDGFHFNRPVSSRRYVRDVLFIRNYAVLEQYIPVILIIKIMKRNRWNV